MAGYFDDILETYRPADRVASVDAPWADPIVDLPPPEPTFPDAGSPLNTEGEGAPRISPETSDPEPLHEPSQEPATSAEEAGPIPGTEPFEPPERIAEGEIRIVETRFEAPPPPEADDGVPWPEPAPDVHLHEHVDRSTTHLHHHLRVVEDSAAFDFEPPGTPEAPALPDAPRLPGSTDTSPDPTLAAIEAELARALARLHGEDAPPLPFLSPNDFEPDAPESPLPPDIETVREVTREVVTEIHHHHTTETRIEPPAAPAPRTAAEASRIGPIRFASAWKSGGR